MRLTERSVASRIEDCFQGFDQAWETSVGEACFSVADRAYAWRTDFPEYGGIVHSAVARPDCPKAAPDDTPCRILVADARRDDRPDIIWADRYFNERIVEAALADTPYRLRYHQPSGFLQVYDRRRRIGLQLMHGLGGRPAWDGGSPLRNFLHWDFASTTLGLVHAGSLSEGTKGVLLAGAGGSGKSGTVLAGIMRGLRSVGDDYVLADLRQHPRAFPLYRLAKQDPEGLRRAGLENHAGLSRTTNWQGKTQFALDAVAPGSVIDRIDLCALLLPHVTGAGATTFTPANAKEAFLAVAPSGVSQVPGDRDKSFALAARVSRELPCWHVHLGTDPDEISAAIRSFIAEQPA